MTVRRKHLLATLAAVFAACGGSSGDSTAAPTPTPQPTAPGAPTAAALCSKFTSSAPALNQKYAPCLPPGQASPIDALPQGSACEAKVAACSDSDRAILSSVLDCLDGLAACTPQTAQQSLLQAQTCLAPTSTLSQPCHASVGL